MRFEKLETLLRVALDMRGNAEGLSLDDIQREHGISRRTAERMANCDVSVETKVLKSALLNIRSQIRGRAFNIAVVPASRGIKIESGKAPRPSSIFLKAPGKWAKRIVVPGVRILKLLEKTSGSALRLTYIAGRLFVNQISIPAQEKIS